MISERVYWLKQWFLDRINKSVGKRFTRLEIDSVRKPVTLEWDSNLDFTINKYPIKDGELVWGNRKNPTTKQPEIVKTTLVPSTATKVKSTKAQVYVCIYGMPVSLDLNDLTVQGVSGKVFIDWKQFSRRINALIDEKTLVLQQQARIELLGQQKKGLFGDKKAVFVIGFILLVLVVAAYFLVINPTALPNLMKGFGESAGRVLTPK